ncbi:MAG: phospholipid carrier-dependent glycosyltransferase [Lachnospiraceae bacterium]|nr:phospholipid carrier-dependent glycosyltransferase [Lachnospiraceae bacterium]
MLFIHLSALSGILVLTFCYWGMRRNREYTISEYLLFFLFFASLGVRLLAASLSKGFGSDTACFASWADRIFQTGPGGFYSPDVFTDYPPGYMYVLWIVGAVRSLFRIEYYSAAHLILLKLPAILCDMVCGLLIFREVVHRGRKQQAPFLCAAWLFNPAVILNSSVWGQVDSCFSLAVIFLCLCLVRRKLPSACVAFGTGLLIKPQMLLFAPLLAAGIFDELLSPSVRKISSPLPCTDNGKHFAEKEHFADSKKLSLCGTVVLKMMRCLLPGLAVIVGMVLFCLPFGLENVWKQYFSTVGSYPYAAVNACNFWGFLGLNWVSQDTVFLGIPYRILGGAAIAAVIALVLLISLKNRRTSEKYPFLGALLIVGIFMFSVRMHERYLYSALPLLLLAWIQKPSQLTFFSYCGFSVLHFYNTAYVLFFYDPANYDRKAPVILLVSAGMLVCTGVLCAAARTFYGTPKRPQPFQVKTSRKKIPLNRADIFVMFTVTFIYGGFALYDLGDRKAPGTALDLTQNQSLTLDFGGEVPAVLSYYIAPWHDRTFSLEGQWESSGQWTSLGEITLQNVFSWQDILLEADVSRLRFKLTESQASLLEFTFLDEQGEILVPVNASDYPALFDEASLHPAESSFRNSMYFDEIYHGRTAYEFLHGLTSYENTHPPMGKILIALGVALFGMNPFGWRIAGALLGIVMVPVIYLFARRLLKDTLPAALVCVLFAFDFMHFTQTRIATIDVYITFFVLLMYYFMYNYACLSFYDIPLKKTLLPLGACGICMGLGIASKWTGVYAGCGLAIIFFSSLYRRYREYFHAKKNPDSSSNGISHRQIIDRFLPCAGNTILFCLVFFVLLPAVIYLLSYLPFQDYAERGLLARMLHNQTTMFGYHSNLESVHPYSSVWYEWPIIRRPIWYYSRIVSQTADGGLREGISAFGNPAVWWAGIPAFFHMLYLWAKKKDTTAAFLVTGYLAQYLPWFFVTRVTFIYHYFPSVVFVVLMIGYSFIQWKKKVPGPAFSVAIILYGGVALALFGLFYPVLAGQPVEAAFVADCLRWFKSWVLTAS